MKLIRFLQFFTKFASICVERILQSYSFTVSSQRDQFVEILNPSNFAQCSPRFLCTVAQSQVLIGTAETVNCKR